MYQLMERIDRWLNKKVNDPTIGSIYENTDYNLDVYDNILPIDLYNSYYTEDDSDIKNNNDIYLYILNEYEMDKYTPFNDKEKDILDFLSMIIERYRPLSTFEEYTSDQESESMTETNEDLDGWTTVKNKNNRKHNDNNSSKNDSKLDEQEEIIEPDNREIDILIAPNTNRYHANYLFKRMVDYVYENEMFYEIGDLENETYNVMALVEPSLKNSFYEFCYNNTKHI